MSLLEGAELQASRPEEKCYLLALPRSLQNSHHPQETCVWPQHFCPARKTVPQNLRIRTKWNRHSWEVTTEWDSWQLGVAVTQKRSLRNADNRWGPRAHAPPLPASHTTLSVYRQGSNHIALLKTWGFTRSLQYKVQISSQHSMSSRIQTQHLFFIRSIKHHQYHTGLWLTDPQPPLGPPAACLSFILCFPFYLPGPGHCLLRLLTSPRSWRHLFLCFTEWIYMWVPCGQTTGLIYPRSPGSEVELALPSLIWLAFGPHVQSPGLCSALNPQ